MTVVHDEGRWRRFPILLYWLILLLLLSVLRRWKGQDRHYQSFWRVHDRQKIFMWLYHDFRILMIYQMRRQRVCTFLNESVSGECRLVVPFSPEVQSAWQQGRFNRRRINFQFIILRTWNGFNKKKRKHLLPSEVNGRRAFSNLMSICHCYQPKPWPNACNFLRLNFSLT